MLFGLAGLGQSSVRQVQEAASQGLKFVGVIPQYQDSRNPACSSLPVDTRGARTEPGECADPENPGTPVGADGSPEPGQGPGGEAPATQQPSWPSGEAAGTGSSPCGAGRPLDGPDGTMAGVHTQHLSGKMEILALFNKPKSHQKCRQYYPVTIPLRVSRSGQTVSGLDANWLEHMSDHFRKGGELVNAVFCLGLVNDSLQGLTDGVFIFEAVSAEDSKTMQGYDAIVVEQWTVLELAIFMLYRYCASHQGVEVQTDYVPLLNSLAAYGWQLTCVLPTPIVKTTREGHVSTKQIVFLQRPCLPQKAKKKESRFQWRFSREDVHPRQMRKSKGKLSARDRQQAEESEKNSEGLFRKAGGVGNCVPGLQQEAGASKEMKGPRQEGSGEGPCPGGRLRAEGGAVQNGPTGLVGAPAGGGAGPGEAAREGAGEAAAEPAEGK
ncbi:hypothetical protein MC885_013001 [Smutsia gigantea]|nr:hypothetical protein MC885_013001 [Smutsia gigantea]